MIKKSFTLLCSLKSFFLVALFCVGISTHAQTVEELMKLVPQTITNSDRAAGDEFGRSVAISGDYAIIGAYLEDEDASGDNTRADAGSAYIFKRNAGTWSLQQKIVASDRTAGDYFGWSVAISGDYAIVGAYDEDEDDAGANTLSDAGSAYIFNRNGTTWSQQQKIVASDRAAGDQFGWSVAISGDYAILGAFSEDHDAAGANTLSGAGSAYIFLNQECSSASPIPSGANSTYTSSYTQKDASGWVHYCSEEGELLLSLDTLGTGALINATEIQLKTGLSNTYSYGTSGGMITNADGYILMDRLWDVNPTTQPSTGNVGVRFYFSNAEYSSIVSAASTHVNTSSVASPTTISSPTDLEFYKATSGSAFARPHTITGIRLHNSTAASLTAWEYAAVGADHSAEFLVSSFSGGGGGVGASDAPLPVALLDFQGEWNSSTVASLSWRTATEINNSHFELERSVDGLDWEHIATVESKAPNGNSTRFLDYAYADANLPITQSYFYYRLIQHDFDETTEIHGPVVLRRTRDGAQSGLDAVLLYPNPFRSEITVLHTAEEDVRLEISNALGMVVYAASLTLPEQTITLDQLPAGIYQATISSRSARQVHKIIKH